MTPKRINIKADREYFRFGEGTKKDNPGFDTVAFWASSGFNADMMVEGPGSYPVYSSAGPGDIVTAMGLCYAITAALYKHYPDTGKGRPCKLFSLRNCTLVLPYYVSCNRRTLWIPVSKDQRGKRTYRRSFQDKGQPVGHDYYFKDRRAVAGAV